MFKIKKLKMMRWGGENNGGRWGSGGSENAGNISGGRTFAYLQAPTSVNVRMEGSAVMANGASIRTWSFGGGFNNNRTVPSPVFEANQGEDVRITLNSMMEHSIHFHGLDVDQRNDGVPATSFAVGGMGNPNSYTYIFNAPHAGTYMYHCHVNTHKHFEMGMFGTVIIRPTDGSTNRVWNDGPMFDKEYIWQLTTFDSTWHSGGMMDGGVRLQRYRPNYFMINGKDGANLNSDTTSAISASAGQKVLVRVNGTSYLPGIVRMGGLQFEVVASDGRPLAQTYMATEILCGPGERYDIIITMPSTGQYIGSIEYRDIRNRKTLGTATTSITIV